MTRKFGSTGLKEQEKGLNDGERKIEVCVCVFVSERGRERGGRERERERERKGGRTKKGTPIMHVHMYQYMASTGVHI